MSPPRFVSPRALLFAAGVLLGGAVAVLAMVLR